MQESIYQLIGVRVGSIRKAKGLTQEQLAELASTSHSYIGDLERGERNVTLQSLEKVSEALGVNFFELFNNGKLPDIEKKNSTIRKIVELLVDKEDAEIEKAFNVLNALFK
ncbi:helix-turn-helix domain-containing protein [Cohnella abietis]|uniref:Transcriptional regulator n=1 Tax=Cohnella abietis TaxID=2507935 RepID=A0A3T1CZY6_9BACL|nr:helix-turn-helix transcriptional regulator [Cohnella abietis]BBI31325.1 transcriptional regulator [Cohnella abietis]